MIIDKLVYTNLEKQKIEKIIELYQTLIAEANQVGNAEQALQYFDEEITQRQDIKKQAERRYILSFCNNKAAVLEDVKEILTAVTKEEFETRQDRIRKAIPGHDIIEETLPQVYNFDSEKSKDEAIRILKSANDSAIMLSQKTYNTAMSFLYEILSLQVQVTFYHFEEPYDQKEQEEVQKIFVQLLERKAAEWYKKDGDFQNDFGKKQLAKIPHTKQFRKLSDYYYLLDPVCTGVFDGKMNIETSMFVAFIDFENLDGVKLSKKLSSYEKFVWHTCVNLIIQDDHDILTLEQIYKAMGNNGKPNDTIKTEILEAIENMSKVRVTVDVPVNSELYPELDQFKGTFQLLATNTKQALSRGQIAKNSIQILEKPQLFYFAKAINQVCSFPATVLEVPVSKTKANITLLNFLLQKILKMKLDDFSQKEILLNEMYVQCNIDDKFKRSRLIKENGGTLRKMLDHFTEYNFIQEYSITTKYIKITF